MQENISEELPDETVGYCLRDQPKPGQPEIPAGHSEQQLRQLLRQKHADAGNANRLDRRREVTPDIEHVPAATARYRSHSTKSKRRQRRSQSGDESTGNRLVGQEPRSLVSALRLRR